MPQQVAEPTVSSEAITPRGESFSGWYQDVVKKSGMADEAGVPGCIVFLPLGFALWENMQRILDADFKKTGVQNVYFPLFIPAGLLEKEKEHVAGFSPQCAVVTHAGGKDLAEPLIVRPTSETIIWRYFSNRVLSHRELPLLVNQWCNVVRWEMRTRPFLRTSEFLWQEGHTAHATLEEAEERTVQMLNIYHRFFEDVLAIPPYVGTKTAQEKFAGADKSYSLEVMAQDGKAIQAGTSHSFGQRFSKAFGVSFQDANGRTEYPFTTSWGVSTRLLGTLILVHGDDRGLVFPPRVAPIQAAVVPIFKTQTEGEQVLRAARHLAETLKNAGLSVRLDDSEHRPGRKFHEWELRGVPVRIEIGPRDLAQNKAVLVRRDSGQKLPVSQEGIEKSVTGLFAAIQRDMLAKARTFRDEHTFSVDNFEDFQETLKVQPGFLRAHWCGSGNCEKEIKAATQTDIRTVPQDGAEPGRCVLCGQHSPRRVLFAKAY